MFVPFLLLALSDVPTATTTEGSASTNTATITETTEIETTEIETTESTETEPVDKGADVLDDDYTQLSLEDLLNVVVTGASRYQQSIKNIPAPVLVVTREQIERRGYRDLKDVFYDLPGFDVSGNVQGEVRTLVVLRGILGNQKLLILQDGQRLNPITGERFVFGNNVPIFHAKRIEVIYGPAAAAYGPDAYAGVVNIVTRDGADINGVEVHTSAGFLSMNENAWATDHSILFGHAWGDVDVMFAARAYRSGFGPDLSEDYDELIAIRHYGSQFEHAEPIQDYDLYGKIKLGNFTLGGRFSDASETSAPSTIPDQYLATDDYVWHQRLHHAFAIHRFETETIVAATTLRYQRYEVAPDSNFYLNQGFTTDASIVGWNNAPIKIPLSAMPEYKYALAESVRLEEQIDWSPYQSLKIVGGVLLEHVLSFPKTKNIRGERFDPDHLLIDMSEFADPTTGVVLGITKDSSWGVRPYTNVGAHLQGEYVPQEELHLSVGCRYDYNTIYGSTLNPRAGLVYKPLEPLSLRGMVGMAYIQPSNYYVWENWANPFAMHIPNADLEPERIITANIGATHQVLEYLGVSLDLFFNRMQDVIRPVPYSQPVYNPFLIIPEEDAYVEINANQGVMYTWGGELKLESVYDTHRFYASYSYLDGKDDEADWPINKVSNHKVLMGADLSFFDDRLTVSPRLRWFSAITMAPFNDLYLFRKAEAEAAGQDPEAVDKTFGPDAGTWLINLTIRGEIYDGLSLFATLNNLLNTTYYTAAPYGESVWILPRAPQLRFNFMAGIKGRVDFLKD